MFTPKTLLLCAECRIHILLIYIEIKCWAFIMESTYTIIWLVLKMCIKLKVFNLHDMVVIEVPL